MSRRLHISRGINAKALGRDPWCWIAFGFGTGLSPYAPGTLGAVLGIFLAWALKFTNMPVYGLVTGGIMLAGVAITGHASRRLEAHDPPGINLDEVAGQLVAAAMVPREWFWLVLAFVLFRVLDILKPWPICWIDRRLGGGLGIMADDIAAGLLAGVVLWGMYTAWMAAGGLV